MRFLSWDLTHRALLMGVVNVTPDSFSDGGQYLDHAAAIAHGQKLAEEGAEILDVGGESTRPGSEPVPEAEELRRVVPVVSALAEAGLTVSIDTSKAAVAKASLEAGARIVNDVTAMRGDPAMLEIVASSDCGLILMHMQGTPRDMQRNPHYGNVVAEVRAFLEERLALAVGNGIAPERIALDPGIGFGKKIEHNLALLRELEALQIEDRPVAVGVSRKSFLGKLLGSDEIEARDWPTVALTAFLREKGARIIRVHAGRPNRDALRMTEAILHAQP